MVILDNHVTKPGWCCGYNDGNGFFGDTFFDPATWIAGLTKIARTFKGISNVVGMSLRNELRGPKQNVDDWFKYVFIYDICITYWHLFFWFSLSLFFIYNCFNLNCIDNLTVAQKGKKKGLQTSGHLLHVRITFKFLFHVCPFDACVCVRDRYSICIL